MPPLTHFTVPTQKVPEASPIIPTDEKTLHDYMMLSNAKNYPNIIPHDDADILLLSYHLYEGPDSGIYEYMDNGKLAEWPALHLDRYCNVFQNGEMRVKLCLPPGLSVLHNNPSAQAGGN